MYIAETEFLFGVRESDKRNQEVAEILSLCRQGKISNFKVSSSGYLEVCMVMLSNGARAGQIQETLMLLKHKLIESSVLELSFSSNDLIRGFELLKRHRLEFFDALHAGVTLGQNAVIVSNDKIYDRVGVRRVSFDDLMNLFE